MPENYSFDIDSDIIEKQKSIYLVDREMIWNKYYQM